MGQSMTKVPYKETFWKGTMRTRPREQHSFHKKEQIIISNQDRCLIIHVSALSGNGTLNKQAGIDYKQLSLLAKINENQSGEVSCTLSFGLFNFL